LSYPKKRLVHCVYRCPSGLIDFRVWPRKREGDAEACVRKLNEIGKNGACEKIRIRSIDGINRLAKATTRFSKPIRIRHYRKT
jgi:hypothetical protein